jgi:4-hydroxy-tetrahydrodipicolinate synthase
MPEPLAGPNAMFSGSSVAIVTPMSQDGQVDLRAMQGLIDWHIDEGTDAIVVTGTTGESATLSTEEHLAVVDATVRFVRKRVPVIAGTGSNSTAQTIALSLAVDELGVDGYLVVTPYYNKPPQEGLYRHFVAVADAVNRPVMLYNVPARTGVDLLPETVARLAEHQHIFAIKEATGDLERARKIRELTDSNFRLYSGDDPTSRDFMLQGGHGVVSVTANVAPKLMAAMCREALAGNQADSSALDEQLVSLHKELFVESNPIPVKWALHKMGKVGPGIRLPLVPMSGINESAVERALQAAEIEL